MYCTFCSRPVFAGYGHVVDDLLFIALTDFFEVVGR